MLTKYNDVRSKKPFEKYFHVCGIFKNSIREGAPNFDMFSSAVFSGRVILKHLEKKGSKGVRGHVPLKKF